VEPVEGLVSVRHPASYVVIIYIASESSICRPVVSGAGRRNSPVLPGWQCAITIAIHLPLTVHDRCYTISLHPQWPPRDLCHRSTWPTPTCGAYHRTRLSGWVALTGGTEPPCLSCLTPVPRDSSDPSPLSSRALPARHSPTPCPPRPLSLPCSSITLL
jgi:hypothetical protein